MAFNRILGFQPVRATRPCQFTPASFDGKTEYRNLRDPGHIAKCRDYPDPQCYLSFTQKYFFRDVVLRHLRVKQFNDYLTMSGEATPVQHGVDDTVETEAVEESADTTHRIYDKLMERRQKEGCFWLT